MIAAGAVVKIIPSDWTPTNIATAQIEAHFLVQMGGTVIRQSQI